MGKDCAVKDDSAMKSDGLDPLPEGMNECDREYFESMVNAAAEFCGLTGALAGSVTLVVSATEGGEFRPMTLTFIVPSKDDPTCACRGQRAVIAAYVDQLQSMVRDVANGAIKGHFAEVLEDSAREMRRIEAERGEPVDPSKAN